MNSALMSLAAQVVVSGLWQGCVLAAAVGLGLRLIPRVSAAQRFAIWLATFFLAIGLPFLSLTRTASGVAAGVVLRVAPGWGLALAGLWLAMFAVRLSMLLAQAWRVRGIWRAARPIEVDPGISVLLNSCPRKPVLCVSDDVTAPSVIGFLRPRLLIPATLQEQLSEPELQQIVLHECEHLRRYDDWLNLLQKLALAVFPLNLALVWVDRRLGLERELACDAGVVAQTGSALKYAACLARLAEHRMGGSRLVLALSAWARRSELARRVYTLLSPVRVVSRVGSRAALAGLMCVLAAGVVELGRVPELVSFAAPAAVSAALVPAAPMPESGAQVVPVMFHSDAQKPVRIARVASHRAAQRRATKRLVLAEQRSLTQREAAPRSFVEVRFSYSFAAVPFGNGWLIVQL